MIDPKDIKAGAQFVVTAAEDGASCGLTAISWGKTIFMVPPEALSPLPTQSPTAAIDAEIVEAAARFVGKWDARRPTANEILQSLGELMNLLDRRRALLKPKDAVGELLEAVEKEQSVPSFNNDFIGPVRVMAPSAWNAIREAGARVRKERGEAG